MGVEKETIMVLKADLQCHCCYRKIKRTFCKFPQIRDQIFDEKNNTVQIVVVCCSPEKIRDKLWYKAGKKVITSIEIKDASKPKVDKPKVVITEKPKDAADKPNGAPPPSDKPKVVIMEKPKEPKIAVVDKPKDAPPPQKPKDAAEKPKSNGKPDKPKSDGAPPPEKPKDAPKPQEQPVKIPEPAAAKAAPAGPPKGPEPVPANGVPSVFPYLGPSYDGYSAGPYYHGYGFSPPPPQPCYEGYYGYGPGQGYGYGPVNGRVGHPNGYFSEENPQGCSIV